MASTYLTRTQGTATDRKKFTLSMWVKLAKTGSQLSAFQFMDFYGGPSDRISLYSNTDDQLQIYHEKQNSGVNEVAWKTDAKLRDLNAWYHIVWRADSTQSTASDRFRVYINGELASLNNTTYPSQNFEWAQGTSSYTQYVGKYGGHSTNNFDGIMSHIHFCDGYSYAPTEFGSTDSTTGEWRINTSPSVTYGNNGYFILKDGNSVTDQSGNSNNFTVAGGTLTNTEDCPSNNFATMNVLDNYYASGSFSNGNNTITTVNTGYPYNTATMGVSSGKWYWECKWSAQPTGSTNQVLIGIAKRVCPSTTTWLGSVAYTYAYQGTGTVHQSDTTIATYTTMSVGDIIGVALDLDNNRLYFSKNGTWQGSSDPANGTNPISITAPDSTSGDSGFYFPAFGDGNNNLQETGQFNFGNGFFGTTAISSEGTNASGIGKFEYDVPNGFTALSTKGLNE